MNVVTTPTTKSVTEQVAAIRAEFPALHQEVHPGKPLVYLDSAATALKPQAVIDAITEVYTKNCANIHRAVHAMSQRATADYEAARESVRAFIGAPSIEEVIFTRGTSEGINLVRFTYGQQNLQPGDEVLVTELEHHSNIVPWQLLCERTGAKLVVVPINDAGEVTDAAFKSKLSARTKIVAFAHVSNALGTVLPVKRFTQLAHDVGAVVVVDGAQGIVHTHVDVVDLDVDFYAFSAHKLYAPTGVGVLYGKRALLEAMPPYEGGGDMIDEVSFEGTTFNDLPHKFEAGTPNIAGVIGLGAAIEWLRAKDLAALHAHSLEVLRYGEAALTELGATLVGTAKDKVSVLAFNAFGAHPTDLGTILDAEGVAIRTGHHCAQPVMAHYEVAGTARASLGIYSTREDIDALIRGLLIAKKMFVRG